MTDDGSLIYKGNHEDIDKFINMETKGKFKVKMTGKEAEEHQLRTGQRTTPMAKKQIYVKLKKPVLPKTGYELQGENFKKILGYSDEETGKKSKKTSKSKQR